ncbi:TetR family transcriptional regulator [Stappia taiwanensis]|uniref:TetR family transcriptional regulator n=1 Tax=Stappia taiwanensis TaxID=992267 RepID=A0A838Y4D7_9HYPH|nr:TetR family transcriptional regulator [Stappia taiwanensis]MBA4613720.1 TetR family transcriptional regulator [Stappia taiwanensis]GGE88166.1 TetR family transcriptional regulator [Stappia taiwanensis]
MRPTKRDELVQQALQAFYRNGFQATGMDMLAAETGISKTSMYKHFRTKEDLILAVLRLRDEHFRNWLYRRMEELAETPRQQLIAMFDALEEWFAEPGYRGCMFIKASSEYQDTSHPIHKQSAEHKRMLEIHITDLARKAELRDADAIARQLLLLKEGAMVTAHLGHTANPAQDAKAAAIQLIEAHRQ